MPKQRQAKKIKFLEERNLLVSAQMPLMAVHVPSGENYHFLPLLLKGLKKLPVQIMVVEKDDPEIWSVADMVLIISDQTKSINIIKDVAKERAVPIAFCFDHGVHFPFANYEPAKEKGNAFLYDCLDEWSIFAAVTRALENYKFPYDWGNISGLKTED